jgi:hypothetical protein
MQKNKKVKKITHFCPLFPILAENKFVDTFKNFNFSKSKSLRVSEQNLFYQA